MQPGGHGAGEPEDCLWMISERREQRSGVADFFRREEQQVAAGSLGHAKIRRVEAGAAWKAATRVRRLLPRANQYRRGENSGGGEPYPFHTGIIGLAQDGREKARATLVPFETLERTRSTRPRSGPTRPRTTFRPEPNGAR